MANTTSNIMAQLFTDPATKIDVQESHGRIRVKRAEITLDALESAAHIFPLGRFQATDRIYSCLGVWDNLGTTFTIDMGIYPETAWSASVDGTAIASDVLVNGQTLATVTSVQTEILGSGVVTTTPELMGEKLFIVAGVADTDAARPAAGTMYDIAIDIATTGTPLAGSAVFTFFYTAGD